MKENILVKRKYLAPELNTYAFNEISVMDASNPLEDGWRDDGYAVFE